MAEQKITPEVFDEIKIMLKYGMTQREVGKRVGVCENTIYFVNRAENYTEYQKYRHDRQIKKEKREGPDEGKVIEHKYNVTIQATHYMEQQQKRTNELLEIISNKLAFIVDELTGSQT